MLLERGGFDIETRTRATQGRLRIRCPHCRWQPGRHSIWTCLPIGHPEYFQDACGHSWNTFDTRGLCPCCAHQWLFTSCLACGRWALHEDWYEPDRNNEPGGP
jgi:hypothetical protein